MIDMIAAVYMAVCTILAGGCSGALVHRVMERRRTGHLATRITQAAAFTPALPQAPVETTPIPAAVLTAKIVAERYPAAARFPRLRGPWHSAPSGTPGQLAGSGLALAGR